MNKLVQVKSLYNRHPYKNWTTVSKLLATGLQGVEIKEIMDIEKFKNDLRTVVEAGETYLEARNVFLNIIEKLLEDDDDVKNFIENEEKTDEELVELTKRSVDVSLKIAKV